MKISRLPLVPLIWTLLVVSPSIGYVGEQQVGSQVPIVGSTNAGRVGSSSFGSDLKSSTGLSGGLSLPGTPGSLQEQTFGSLSYQIHILGEVSNPGTYRANASTRLYEALQLAGGISAQGSERRVELRREGSKSKVVDLLSFKRRANLDANPYLLDNDVIYVPLSKKVVQIMGAVKKPGPYELTHEKTVQDLVELAQGFTPGAANPTPFKIVRFEKDQKQVLSFDNVKEQRDQVGLQNADVVVIPHILTHDKKFDYNLASLPGDNALFYPSYEERVFVIGAVDTSGPLPYSPYYTLRQYLTLAGGTTKLAKPMRKWRVITPDGKRQRAKMDTPINPGDAIIIPERYMAPESWLSIILGTSSAALGITTTVLTLTR